MKPPKQPASASQAEPAKRFRVWDHGALHCNGASFRAGEELPMSEVELIELDLLASGVAIPVE